MRTLVEVRRNQHTHFGFYVGKDEVKFEYSGPFDLDTGEWVSAIGNFSKSDFTRAIKTLESKSKCEITGTQGERLRLRAKRKGKMELDLRGGYGNNITISESDISPSALRLDLPS